MFFIYNIFLLIILLISPIILIIRIFLGKEDKIRFKEKFCFFAKRSHVDETIWFHGASVGEITSIIPIIKNFENKQNFSLNLILSSFPKKILINKIIGEINNIISKKIL